MLAIIYLVIMYVLGDSICRRFYPFLSSAHRFAAAFTCGLLVSSWWTYLSCLPFSGTSSPLLWGNLVFFVTSIVAIYLLRRWPISDKSRVTVDRTSTRFKKWDWVFTGVFVIYSCWLMFGTFSMSEGKIQIANHESSDFGSNVSIMQSFALGHNFPTVYPHFTGERIHYHFLFYFQSGNFEYLGLSPSTSNNVLSAISLIAMLILVMTLGAVVFGSRVIGRIGAALFIFHGSLSFIPYLYSKGSVSAAISAVWAMIDFLPSGFPYRGELWGVWSQVVYANQRHLPSSISIFLLVLIFLFIRYRDLPARVRKPKKIKPVVYPAPVSEDDVWQDREEASAQPIPGENEGMAPGDMVPGDAVTDYVVPGDAATGDVVPGEAVPGDEVQGDVVPVDEATPPPVHNDTAVSDNDPFSSVVDEPRASDDDENPQSDAENAESQQKPLEDISAHESSPVKDDRQNMEVRPPENEFAADDDDDDDDENILDLPELEPPANEDGTPQDEPLSLGAIVPKPDDEEALTVQPAAEEPRSTPPEAEIDHTTVDKKPLLIRLLGEPVARLWPYVFSGALLGLMPMWNGAIFAAAFAVLAGMLVLFPLRRQLIVMALAVGIFALPQFIYLRGGHLETGYSLFHWGYIIDRATVWDALKYIGFIFGLKWPLIILAIIIGTRLQRLLMLATTSLFIATFFFQFSPELLANHKFLNVWLIIANLFVASGLVFLWKLRILRTTIPGKLVAIIFGLLIFIGGFIDLFPIHNSYWTTLPFTNDPLVNWVRQDTDPRAIFLSERYVNHGILMAGRRLFYGHPYYAWGANYDTTRRDAVYREMLESKDIARVFRLLKENEISYVAIDNSIRKGEGYIKSSNEPLLASYFPTVFSDDEHAYNDLRIFQVPDALPEGAPSAEIPPEVAETNAFESRPGDSPGLFSRPRGIAADNKGYFYVSDTENARVQKFDADGKFVMAVGNPGAFEGQIKEPNGLAIDQTGNIYATDSHNHKLIKFGPDGKFIKEWRGPDSGFYGPRDIAFGPNGKLYVVDQGRTRIARFDPETEQFSLVWGTPGTGEGQFSEPTGIAVGADLVFVTDLGNQRIQAFDLEGQFVRQWAVPVWQKSASEFPDVVYDEQTKRLYVTSGSTNELLTFDINGTRLDNVPIQGSLDNPSSLTILEANKKRWLLILNTGGSRIVRFELEAKKAEPEPKKGK